MAEANTAAPTMKVELVKDIKVIYYGENFENKKYEATASSDGVALGKIVFSPEGQRDNGDWDISFIYKKEEKVVDAKGVISDEDKKKTDEAGKRRRSDVVLRSHNNSQKKNKAAKLITHTNIGAGFYSRRDSQRKLTENSVFEFWAEVFTECNTNQKEFYDKGDFYIEKKYITFCLCAPLSKKRASDEAEDTFSAVQVPAPDKDTDNEKHEVWRIRYSIDDEKDIFREGEIIDKESQRMIVRAVNDACRKITRRTLRVCELGKDDEEQDDDGENDRISLVSFPGYNRDNSDDKKAIVYSVEAFGYIEAPDYCIYTGLFCGVINFGKDLPPLEIRTEYTDTLVLRMIDRCCGIYVSSNPDLGDEDQMDSNFYSKIVQYMYLLSLRKVISILLPKRYRYLKDRGYEIRGNIDINEYINRDIIAKDKKLSFVYPERQEIQPVVDVLYAALKSCNISGSSSLPNIKNYKDYLGSIYSGRHPSSDVVRNIGKEKILKSGLYASFKRPLELAKVLLENGELSAGELESDGGISALLMDSSYMWETYLESVMRQGLEDWDIAAQNEIVYYPKPFFTTVNRPDFILRHRENGKVFILDAKFKHMEFRQKDVDNDDLQQLHCYSYYHLLTEGKNFRGTALIYPTRANQTIKEKKVSDKFFFDKMFGREYADDMESFDQKFGVLTLKDANELEKPELLPKTDSALLEETTILDLNEEAFISRLKAFLEN